MIDNLPALYNNEYEDLIEVGFPLGSYLVI